MGASNMAEPAPSAADAAPPPKSRKKLLLVIAAAVVLLGGAGTGAWFFLGKKPEQAATESKDGKKDKKGKPVKAVKEEAKPKLPAQFVELDPPFVVNFEPGATARFLQIAVQLMTRDAHMVEFLKANSPIIRNDLLLLFGNRHVEEVATNEGKEALRKAALDTVRKIVNSEGGKGDELEAVYFTSFVMQ
ncbi:MAG TPA: flagellar basal body-associated FliL family protein [Steroidobacteraceae bacterium]|nr:flagellar basal body-associated FliL family protein [Steroidobacteraceae bacterium]